MSERESLLLRAHARQELQYREIVRRCREQVISHDVGVMYWLRNWTSTINFHWQEQGRQPVAPFPYVPYPREWWTQERLDALRAWFPHTLTVDDPPDYLDIVMGFLLTQKRVNIPKSREMLTSWSVCGYAAWKCQFFDAVEFVAQSEKDEKAQGLVRYVNTLYEKQPDWLRDRFPLKSGVAGTKHEIQYAHGSKFAGLPQGVRQCASYHPTVYFSDESAHQPEYLATLSVAAPVARQIICISSAAPGGFADECEQPQGTA